MGRPQYESPEDRLNERMAVAELCRLYECKAYKLPISYGLDYALVRDSDRIIALAEIKCRKNNAQRYETIMVAGLKRTIALSLRRALNVPTLFVPVFSDGVFIIDFKEKPDAVTLGGRRDRGDSADIEPMVHYRTERLIRAGFVNLIQPLSP